MTCTLDGHRQLALVLRTRTRDPAGDDAPLLRNGAGKPLFILVIDIDFFGVAEPTGTFLALLLVASTTASAARSTIGGISSKWWSNGGFL